MNTSYLSSLSGLLGTLFLTGTLFAAQPQSHAVGTEHDETSDINFADKPHAPIDVIYQFQNTPEVGQPLVIELQFIVSGETRVMDTDYRGESQLVISSREDAEIVSGAGVESIVSQTITTTPQANGLYHLSAFASVWVNGRALRRVVSIPVQVGPKSDTPVVADKLSGPKDVDGVRIRALPVETTITQK